jgi:hypothetical protein
MVTLGHEPKGNRLKGAGLERHDEVPLQASTWVRATGQPSVVPVAAASQPGTVVRTSGVTPDAPFVPVAIINKMASRLAVMRTSLSFATEC